MRSSTQREYTTPTLKQGTRYEVEVWAVTSVGEGTRKTQVATTYQGEYILHCQSEDNELQSRNYYIIIKMSILQLK